MYKTILYILMKKKKLTQKNYMELKKNLSKKNFIKNSLKNNI